MRKVIRVKKISAILVCIIICLFSLSPSAMAEEAVYYTFDASEKVTVVTNELSAGEGAVYEDGYEGNSISLDGSYGLYLGDVGNTFSVSAMVKVTSTGGTDTIFFKNMGTASSQKWTGVLSNNGKPAFWTHGDGYSWKTVASGSDAVLNSWANVLYTENNGVGSLYVNDELVGSGNVSKGSGQLYLGVTYWASDALSGLIDEIKVYDYDIKDTVIEVPDVVIGDIELKKNLGMDLITWISSDEGVVTSEGKVTRHEADKAVTLTATLNGETVGEFEVTVLKKPVIVNNEVLLSYKFNEGEGAIIYDDSGNGNHGVASGGLQISENGAVFDGIDDYIAMPEGALCGSDKITVISTITPWTAQKKLCLYSFGNTDSHGRMSLNPSCPDTNAICFAATKTTRAEEKEIVSVPGIRAGDTNTVIVVIDGSHASMYIDGDLVMDGDIGMTVSDLGVAATGFIGKSLYEEDLYFSGIVSEFTVLSYCMKESDIKALYKKAPEYQVKEKEEYITRLSFKNGIEAELDTQGRSDVKLAAVVLDENNSVIDFSTASSSSDLTLTGEGTIVVFAYNEEDNVPGKLYVKGKGDGFEFEYTPGKISIVTYKEYKNGMMIIAGYDTAGSLTGVTFALCDVNKGESVQLKGEFENAVTFRMLYLENLTAAVPVE